MPGTEICLGRIQSCVVEKVWWWYLEQLVRLCPLESDKHWCYYLNHFCSAEIPASSVLLWQFNHFGNTLTDTKRSVSIVIPNLLKLTRLTIALRVLDESVNRSQSSCPKEINIGVIQICINKANEHLINSIWFFLTFLCHIDICLCSTTPMLSRVSS